MARWTRPRDRFNRLIDRLSTMRRLSGGSPVISMQFQFIRIDRRRAAPGVWSLKPRFRLKPIILARRKGR